MDEQRHEQKKYTKNCNTGIVVRFVPDWVRTVNSCSGGRAGTGRCVRDGNFGNLCIYAGNNRGKQWKTDIGASDKRRGVSGLCMV